MEEEKQEEMRDATRDDGTTQSLSALRDAIDSSLSGASVITDAHHTCRFSELRGLIFGIQSHLAELGVQPGDCVALELANTVPCALLALSCLDAGLSVMLFPMEGLGARVAGSKLEVPRFCRWIATVRDGLRAGQRRLGAPETYAVVRRNPNYDSASPAARGRGTLFFRTSGSLGVPKIVARSVENYLTNIRHARERLGLGPGHRAALPVPIFHGFGFGPAFLSCLFGGASIDLQDRSNLLRYLERERQFDPNVAFVTPSLCEILTRGRRAPRPYEFMLTGGDRVGRSAFFRSEELHGPLISAYGCSEIGFLFCGDVGMSAELRSRTVGRPLPFVEFRVVTEPSSSDDSLGTLQIRYPYRSDGYVDFGGSAVGYGGALLDDGWYSSADLARPGPDGTVEVVGRQDLSVKRNSVLLPFADVEAALRNLDGVEDAGVAIGPEGIRGRMLVGYCAVRDGSERSEAELRAELVNRVPSFAVPELIRAVPALPRLPNGKIDRATLGSWAQSETFPAAGSA